MNVQNEMKLSFLSHSVNEAFARTAVTSFFTQLDPTVDELADIKTAVSEAVTNCIVHAYRDTIGPIQIVARVLENNGLAAGFKSTGGELFFTSGEPGNVRPVVRLLWGKQDLDVKRAEV
jgi:stage II sporulation protein AB (anti-sigma F factor)